MLVRIGKASISCKEAKTPDEQRIGLSQTASLADGEGMLFSYLNEVYHSFWMPKSMKFPIDIVFIHDDSSVGRIHEHCEPGASAKFLGRGQWVLEVPAGFCAKLGVKKGDAVEFEEEHEAMQSSDLLRTLSTASMGDLPVEEASMGHLAQSTESDPYSRSPSPTQSNPTERFMGHDTFDNQIPEGGAAVTNGPIHDEEWNSPTRASAQSLSAQYQPTADELAAKATLMADPRVQDVYFEYDKYEGAHWWVDLQPGYNWCGCSVIHSPNIVSLITDLEDVRQGPTASKTADISMSEAVSGFTMSVNSVGRRYDIPQGEYPTPGREYLHGGDLPLEDGAAKPEDTYERR